MQGRIWLSEHITRADLTVHRTNTT